MTATRLPVGSEVLATAETVARWPRGFSMVEPLGLRWMKLATPFAGTFSTVQVWPVLYSRVMLAVLAPVFYTVTFVKKPK